MSVPHDDPALRARLDRLLRSCIQCGLCLPHCATYLATGSEAQSPRGRLLLLGELLTAPERPPEPSVLTALDQCLGCQACITACPSGVALDLFEAAKTFGHAARRGVGARVMTALLARRSVLRGLRAATAPVRVFAGPGARGPAATLRHLAASVPWSPGDAALVRLLDRLTARAGAGRTPPSATERSPETVPAGASGPPLRVALFAGCASADLLPSSQRRLRALLAAAGCELVEVGGQTCCGALAAHAGQTETAARSRAANLAAFASIDGVDVVVVEAAGCGLELRHSPPVLSERVRDAAVLLAGRLLPPAQRVPLRVVYHDPCHARHGQGIVREPRTLLARIPGLTLVDPEEAEVCCGSGGPYALLHPDLSARMGRRKAGNLAASGADLVVTGNPGCLGQIQAALGKRSPALPVLPLTDLLWYACLGRIGVAAPVVST
jgi:glycolate oxidase iron-sulfur subunit